MAVPVQRIGGTMTEQQRDSEFEHMQSRLFRPARVRRMLSEYHALLDPWQYEDENEAGMIYRTQRINPDPAIYRLADLKASIDSAIHRLTADDPLAYIVIHGLYIERMDWSDVSADTGLPVHPATKWDVTVAHVEDRAVYRMARYLGWRREQDG